jgi:hypothetical protein
MTYKAVWLWEGVLDGLKAIARRDNIRREDGVKELLTKIDRGAVRQPKASWKRLVRDEQVRGLAHSHA